MNNPPEDLAGNFVEINDYFVHDAIPASSLTPKTIEQISKDTDLDQLQIN